MGEAPRKSLQLKNGLAGPDRNEAASESSRTILVVDDDADITRFFSAVLASRGFKTVSAYDPVQGFLLAQKQRPQLIVVDWHMPAGGGPEMLRKLRENQHTSSIPVVVVTSDSAPNLRAEATALGAKLFLHKPLDPDRLVEVVGRFMGDGG
jgi:two-component system chemotaxis response regulator CheY